SALGTMFTKLIWCTRSPDSIASGRVATEGVPINAPRPLPRPVRAMRLRLREQFHQRKQQSDSGARGNFGGWSSAPPSGPSTAERRRRDSQELAPPLGVPLGRRKVGGNEAIPFAW